MSEAQEMETHQSAHPDAVAPPSGSDPMPANDSALVNDQPDDEPSRESSLDTPVKESAASGSGTPASSRKAAKRGKDNRMYHTLMTGTKVKHIKKSDGEPLWRVDIQYDFLYFVFFEETKAFRSAYDPSKRNELMTFADVYIEAMANSSKTSRVLRDKLIHDKNAALHMAMVCLLVNIGRMNTTLNFFPEMRAQLRTYHPIPSLQAYSNQSDSYKQLQDAPRLKSILKGACEDRSEPVNFKELAQQDITKGPSTNPVNMVFLIATFATEVQELLFLDGYDFTSLIMRSDISSESRGRVFLWLLWAYLETDLSPEMLRKNPFGYGQMDGTKVPSFRLLTPEEEKVENVDSPAEIEYGDTMRRERLTNLETALINSNAMLAQANPGRRARKSLQQAGSGFEGAVNLEDPDFADDNDKSNRPKRGVAKKRQRIKAFHEEVNLLIEKMMYKERKQRKWQGLLRREYLQMRKGPKDFDLVYDSDTETFSETKKIPSQPEMLDYKALEESVRNCRALQRSSKWLERWKY